MAVTMKRYSSIILPLIVALCFAAPAAADSGLSPEQQMNLTSLIYITITTSVLTAAVSLRHYWRSKLRDWTIILQSFSMVSAVSFICFMVSLAPLFHTIDVPEAVFLLYLPSLVFVFFLLSFSMWIRTFLHNHELAYALSVESPFDLVHLAKSVDVQQVRKTIWLWQRERRIAKSKRYWAKREAQKLALQQKAAEQKKAAKPHRR